MTNSKLSVLILALVGCSVSAIDFGAVTRAVDEQIRAVNSLCDANRPKECVCTLDNGPDVITSFTLRDLATCRPRICNCQDGTQVNVPVPNLPAPPAVLERVGADHVARLNNLCRSVGSELEMCPCNFRKGSSIKPPIRVADLGLCLPVVCRCVDGTELPVPPPNFQLGKK